MSLSKRIWNIFKYILAVLLVWFVFSKTSVNDIIDLFRRVSFLWLVISFVLFFLMTMMKAMQYYILSGRQAPYPRVLSIVVVQNAITNFIATGAGIASYLTMFTVDEGVRLRRASATFVIAKIGDLVVVWFMLLVAGFLLRNSISGLGIATLTVLIVIPLAIGAFVALIVLRQKFVEAIRTLADRLQLERFSFTQRGLEVLQFLAEQNGMMVLRLIQTAIICSLVYMALTMAWVYASLRAFFVDRSCFRSRFCEFLDSTHLLASDSGFWRTWSGRNQPDISIWPLWNSCFADGCCQRWTARQFIFIQPGFASIFAFSSFISSERFWIYFS